MTISLILAALVSSVPATPQGELEKGLVGAFRGCEEWILNPASWVDGSKPFVETVGLGDKMGLVDQIPDMLLPPQGLRRGSRYWRISSTESTGYFLVVSDQLPMCHITGGGSADLQPVVEGVLASQPFLDRWHLISNAKKGDMLTRTYRNRAESKLSLVVSDASQPGQSRDRIQVLATATFALKN